MGQIFNEPNRDLEIRIGWIIPAQKLAARDYNQERVTDRNLQPFKSTYERGCQTHMRS